MRYIKITLSGQYVGGNDYCYLYTDMSDGELWEYIGEEATSHNEWFAQWIQDNAPDASEDEWNDYWDDYVAAICECCSWEELNAKEVAEIDKTYWKEM